MLRFDYQSCPGPVLGFKFCNQSCPGPVLEAKFAHQSCPGPVLGSFYMAMKKTEYRVILKGPQSQENEK